MGTWTEFEYYLKKWSQRSYDDYPLLYLAFHGNEGVVYIGDRRFDGGEVEIQEIGEILQGKCHGRIIHFGSCNTVCINGHCLNRFLRQTKALAVTGYQDDVRWVDSAAFEILLFSFLQENSLLYQGAMAMRRKLHEEYHQFCKKLQFRMVIRKPKTVKSNA